MEFVLVGRPNVGKSSLIRQLTGLCPKTGKKPGTTRKIKKYKLNCLEIVDLPGFGFMSGVSRKVQEKTKTEIVRYLERNQKQIVVAVEVIDVRSFLEIADRWKKRGQIPVDVEFFYFLRELHLDPIMVVNKIDTVYPNERDDILDAVCEKFDLSPPWKQWIDLVAPVSARTGEGLTHLRRLIESRLRKRKLEQMMKHFRKQLRSHRTSF